MHERDFKLHFIKNKLDSINLSMSLIPLKGDLLFRFTSESKSYPSIMQSWRHYSKKLHLQIDITLRKKTASMREISILPGVTSLEPRFQKDIFQCGFWFTIRYTLWVQIYVFLDSFLKITIRETFNGIR